MNAGGYVGRFAPSPTGPLHAGSLVAALASWLDARAHPGGRWLVRVEDVDTPRCVPGAGEHILAQLATCGLHSDAPPWWQSQRSGAYAQALLQLRQRGLAYPCACSRKDIAAAHAAQGQVAQRHTQLPYPGTCRAGLPLEHGALAWRFNSTDFWSNNALKQFHADRAAGFHSLPVCGRAGMGASSAETSTLPGSVEIQQKTAPAQAGRALTAPFFIAGNTLHWCDRRLGAQQQDVLHSVGDFVLCRADGLWAYQLAVVVDDAAQGITQVVRGEDLADNTPRQMLLQAALGMPVPRYLHTPLVRGADGEKLSKQHGAAPLDLAAPLLALNAAAAVLGLPAAPTAPGSTLAEALAWWVRAWAHLYNPGRD